MLSHVFQIILCKQISIYVMKNYTSKETVPELAEINDIDIISRKEIYNISKLYLYTVYMSMLL